MTIRGIFFDAADVFYERRRPTAEFVRSMLSERGLPDCLPPGDEARLRALYDRANGGLVSPTTYWDTLLTMYGVVDPGERARLIDQIMVQVHDVRAIPGGPETLAVLKQRGFLLGIITDTIYPPDWKVRWLEQVGVARFIDVMACSSTLGVHKPNPAIYLRAVEQAGLSVPESAFVGHDAAELAGAQRVGLATVAVRADPGARGDYQAGTLLDLLDVPIFQTSNVRKVLIMRHGVERPDIEAIFLDVGNTLRVVVKDPSFQADARRELGALAGATEPPEVFLERLMVRWKIYREWSFETLIEASERELWTRFLLPDYPAERIGPLAGRLTRLWRNKDGRRVPRGDVKDTVIELSRRGYCLGIIANTITETEIPDWLEAEHLGGYFTTMVLSSIYGHRKPGPEIYLEAARQMGVPPAHCAYVGDNPSRDVLGTRLAGFGMSIILPEPGGTAPEVSAAEGGPDVVIRECRELLDLFPPRIGRATG